MRNIQNIQIRHYTRLHLKSILLVLMFTMSFGVSANHGINRNMGKMISGYDVVAYYTMGDAVRGSKDFSIEWLGGKWLFATQEHRELFLADPASYIPQYGGYCSSSYLGGDKHGYADPRAWQIVDGKLYLFYSKGLANRWDAKRWNTNRFSVQAAIKEWENAKAGLLQQ